MADVTYINHSSRRFIFCRTYCTYTHGSGNNSKKKRSFHWGLSKAGFWVKGCGGSLMLPRWEFTGTFFLCSFLCCHTFIFFVFPLPRETLQGKRVYEKTLGFGSSKDGGGGLCTATSKGVHQSAAKNDLRNFFLGRKPLWLSFLLSCKYT